MIFELIARLFPKGYNKAWAAVNAERIKTGNMVVAFSDLEGHTYYRVHQEMSLPIERVPYLMAFWEQLLNGVTNSELRQIIDIIEDNLEKSLKDPKHKAAAKIGACTAEIKYRLDNILHAQLIYDVLAISLFRDDEDPHTFNEAIHVEKIAAFKEIQKKKGAYNFFKEMPELVQLSNFFQKSEQEWQIQWMQSLARQTRIESLKTILS